MRLWSRDVVLGVLAGVALLSGLALGAWSFLGPKPTGVQAVAAAGLTLPDLQRQVAALAQAGKFGEAQQLCSAFLERQPANGPVRVMLAELALDRPDPQPELALEQLQRVQSDDPRLTSQVRLDQGKAFYKLSRFDEAEAAWKEALRLNPTIPEAGWALLDLDYVQGRAAEARRLGLALFQVEPDPHDRAQLLLELVRQDAQPVDPASVAKLFEPVLKRTSDDPRTRVALGLALVKDNRSDEGLDLLRKAAAAHPQDADAWDALLTGLGLASQSDELAKTLQSLPADLAGQPRFAKHQARVAWDRRDWKAAAEAYRRAWEAEPEDHEVLYRLANALRNAGDTAAADPIDRRARQFESAREDLGDLYAEANAVPTLGTAPHSDLYRRLADNREAMGRFDQARAWLALCLHDDPADAEAAAALKRLDAEHPARSPADPKSGGKASTPPAGGQKP